jgi:hypothetical protein
MLFVAHAPATPPVRAELVEALSFLFYSKGEGRGFDRLSPNGCGAEAM